MRVRSGDPFRIHIQDTERKFYFRGKRAFPSCLQTGPSFFIEKSKRRMIAEDIRAAMRSAK